MYDLNNIRKKDRLVKGFKVRFMKNNLILHRRDLNALVSKMQMRIS